MKPVSGPGEKIATAVAPEVSQAERVETLSKETGEYLYAAATMLLHAMLIQGGDAPKHSRLVYRSDDLGMSLRVIYKDGAEPTVVTVETADYLFSCRRQKEGKYKFEVKVEKGRLDTSVDDLKVAEVDSMTGSQQESDLQAATGIASADQGKTVDSARSADLNKIEQGKSQPEYERQVLDLLLDEDRALFQIAANEGYQLIEEIKQNAFSSNGLLSKVRLEKLKSHRPQPQHEWVSSEEHLRFISESIKPAWEAACQEIDEERRNQMLRELLELHINRYHDSFITAPAMLKRNHEFMDKFEAVAMQFLYSYLLSGLSAIVVQQFWSSTTGSYFMPDTMMTKEIELIELAIGVASGLLTFVTLNMTSIVNYLSMKSGLADETRSILQKPAIESDTNLSTHPQIDGNQHLQ